MNLKKNDKIILIAGVAILIIAGIGIAVYTSPDIDENNAGNTQPDYISYPISWYKHSGNMMFDDNLYVEKKSTYSDSFTIDSSKDNKGSVLTNIEIQIIWEDDHTYGILRTKGEDTLTVTVTDENGQSETMSGKPADNITFQINNINDVPRSDSIFAEDKENATEIIEGMIYGKNTANFKIDVEVDTGERFIRLIKYIRDKGNDFEIKVLYTYYSYEIENPTNDNNDMDENKDTGDDGGSNIGLGDFYKNLCYGRSMI